MELSLPAYDRFEGRPADLLHLKSFADAADCDLFALLLGAQLGSADLAICCADNKAAQIAIGLIEDIFLEGASAAVRSLMPVNLLRAVECARLDLDHPVGSFEVPSPASPRLTTRQLECLSWAQSGKSSFDIGTILGLSPRTVDWHVRDACARLGVRTRVQAVSQAVALGYLAPQVVRFAT